MLPNAGNALNMNPCTASNELVHLSDQACLTAVSHCYVMGEQAPLTASQREKVVRYINELAEDFRLQCNTATLACNYFDRYLSSLTMHEIPAKEKVHHVQMIASTCLLISAKFYDCKMPPLSALVQVHGGRVTPGQFSALELAILAKLGWCLHVVHAASFLEPLKRLFVGPDGLLSRVVEDRAHFFIDLAVYSAKLITTPPCMIAVASLLLGCTLSELHVPAPGYDEVARECDLDSGALCTATTSLLSFYHLCFPERVQLFKPIRSKTLTDHVRDEMEVSASPPPMKRKRDGESRGIVQEIRRVCATTPTMRPSPSPWCAIGSSDTSRPDSNCGSQPDSTYSTHGI